MFRFYSAGFFLLDEDICRHFYGVKDVSDSFDVKALSSRVDEVLDKMESLQDKIELIVQDMEKNKNKQDNSNTANMQIPMSLETGRVEPDYSQKRRQHNEIQQQLNQEE